MYVDYKGGNVEGRIARYISNFTKEAEVYIAIGLANRLSKDSIIESYLSNMKKPYKSQEFIDALREGGYEAERIKNKGLVYSKYIPTFVGLKMLEQDSIYKANNYSLQDSWVNSGNVAHASFGLWKRKRGGSTSNSRDNIGNRDNSSGRNNRNTKWSKI